MCIRDRLLLIELHAEPRSIRHFRHCRSEQQRLREQVRLVVERTDQISRAKLAVNFRQGGCDMQHGCSTDAELQVAADGTLQPGCPGYMGDLRSPRNAAVLAGVNTED